MHQEIGETLKAKFAPSSKWPVIRKQRQGSFRGEVRLSVLCRLKNITFSHKKVKPLSHKVFFLSFYDCTLCIENIQTSRCCCKTPVADVSIFCLENYFFGSLATRYESNCHPCKYQVLFSDNWKKNTELRNWTSQSSGVDRSDTGEANFFDFILLGMLLFLYDQEMLGPKM